MTVVITEHIPRHRETMDLVRMMLNLLSRDSYLSISDFVWMLHANHGIVYDILEQLVYAQLITSHDASRVRKVYRITARGRRCLDLMNQIEGQIIWKRKR